MDAEGYQAHMKKKAQILQLGTREARKQLAEILNLASEGMITVITKRKARVAAVVSGQCQINHVRAAQAATRNVARKMKESPICLMGFGTREARRQWAEILGLAADGTVVVISKDDVVVAAVISGQCQPSHIRAARSVTRKAASNRKSLHPKSESDPSYHLVMHYSEVEWYKADPMMPYAHRIADFLDKAAVKIPYHIISASMLARVIEGRSWTPSGSSFDTLRVRRNIPAARRHLFNLPSRRMLYSVPHMGYLASVDELHEQRVRDWLRWSGWGKTR